MRLTPGRDVGLVQFFGQLKSRKLAGERTRIIAADLQAAAVRRSIRGERGEDQVAADRQRPAGQSSVPFAIARLREEMEDGPVMPDVELPQVRHRRHIRFNPLHSARPAPQS